MQRFRFFLILAAACFPAWGGTYSSPQFTDSSRSASSNFSLSTTATIAINRWGVSNVLNANLNSANVDSGASDVTCFGAGRFGFFWSATLAAQKAIYKREYLFSNYIATPQGDVTLYNLAQNRVQYLHADYGTTRYLATYTDNSMQKTALYTLNGIGRDSIRSNLAPLRFSQCHVHGDTFLVAVSSNYRNVVIKKVIMNGSSLTQVAGAYDTVVADIGTGNNRLHNPSVAADTLGNIGVTWSKGPVSDAIGGNYKQSYYRFYYGVLSSSSAATALDYPVCDTTTSYWYDDGSIVSYRPKKFASAAWAVNAARQGFIYLNRFWVNDNNTISHLRDTVIIDSLARFVTIAASRNYVAVAWLGTTPTSRQSYVLGRRYQIVNDSLRLDLVQSLVLSDAVVTPVNDPFNSAINLALDSVGNMAVTWKKDGYCRAGLWANKPFLYDTARFESRTQSLPVQTGDSVFFNPLAITNAGVDGSYEPYIQFSTDNGLSFGSWMRFRPADAATITAARGAYTDFRYALVLIRSNTDSARAPILSNAQISWDIQPRFLPLDSMQVRGRASTIAYPGASFGWGDTITTYSRSDSVNLFYHGWDSDTALDSIVMSLQWRGQTYLRDTLRFAERFFGQIQLPSVNISDTVFSVQINGEDGSAGWRAPAESMFVKTINFVPQLSVRAIWDSSHTGVLDTIAIGSSGMISIQQTDSVLFEYWMVDSNDGPRGRTSIYKNGVELSDVSMAVGDTGRSVFYGASQLLSQPDDLLFFAADPEDTVRKLVGIGVNHFPAINALSINSKTVQNNGDSTGVRLQSVFTTVVSAADSDLSTWDTLTYIISIIDSNGAVRRADSTFGDSTLSFVPQFGDRSLRTVVYDRYAIADTFLIHFKYPFFVVDSAIFPQGHRARDTLAHLLTLISGGGFRDTVLLPFNNSGNDTLNITGVFLGSRPLQWFTIGLPSDTGTVWYDSLTGSDTAQLMAIAPNTTVSFFCVFNPDVLSGDGIVYDSLFITTDDPLHPRDTIPLELEYNDLPTITSLRFDFTTSDPYWLAKNRAVSNNGYSFPPHAKIIISFSEPMRPDSALSAVKIFSIFDSVQSDTIAYIPIDTLWTGNHTSLTIQPRYQDTSAFFNLRPPVHLFIPTDSIALVIRDVLTDQASTPSAPQGNSVDIHQTSTRIAGADTVFKLRVDSISFRLNQVVPAAGQGDISTTQSIKLLFSGSIFPGSIDTSKTGNSSLTISSRFSRGQVIPFDTVIVEGAIVTFVPALRFYYGDSVFCRYRSYAARDSLGYPVDLNGNGIPSSLFDSTSMLDDTSWSFFVQSIAITSVFPESASASATIHTPITLTFNHPLVPGILDTATGHANRSFMFTSRYGLNGPLPLRRVTISADSLTATFTPESTFICTDSIWCRFRGFAADYQYDSILNLPTDTTAVTAGRQWFFFTRDEGFYTFPNPYKPALNPRHCNAQNQPCGIWFKNLHVLKPGVNDLAVVIYDITALPLYDTRKAGVLIHFDPSMPQFRPLWKWDTRNQYGQLVGSGIYLYAIFDLQKNILKKGKIIIVR